MGFFQYKIKSNVKFREVVKDKFNIDIKNNFLPDQTYINRLIASLEKTESNNYSQCYNSFISEYEYLKKIGFLLSIKSFTKGCLNQLLWINTILESGKVANKEEELEEKFDYSTPTMHGNPWTLDKVTKKGVYFRGDDPYQDVRVIINSDNIIDIAIALSNVNQKYNEHITAKKQKQDISKAKLVASKTNESTLFKSKDLEIKCLNVLKDINHPVLDIRGGFIGKTGMKGAIVVWYYFCKKLGFISTEIKNTRGVVAKEVMKLIPNLSIEGSSFDKEHKAKKYKEDIEEKLAQISSK